MTDPNVAALLTPPRVAELGPGSPNEAARDKLRALEFAQPARDPLAARACLAGLWLYHDFLDESHAISQELDTKEGSFWHAIMHRREPDAGNSKYWWHRVGPHPVLDQLVKAAPGVGYAYTTPQAFVDFCERVRGTRSADEDLAKRVQALEWQLLFDWCYRRAFGE
jgi:hypothetical protein